MMAGLLYWQWLAIGLAFLILEMFAPGAILLWFGIGAGVLGLILTVFPWINLPMQLLIFAGLSLAGLLIGRRYLRLRPMKSDKPTLSRRGESYIGKTFELIKPIKNGAGAIRIGDTDWRVEGADLAEGSSVKVTGVSGASLQVTAVAE